MANNRAKGSGSVDKRGKSYRARYVAPDGERVVKTFSTQRAATTWLREELGKIDRGEWIPPSKYTLAEWLPEFVTVYKPHAATGTLDSYRYSINRLQKHCPKLMETTCSNIDQLAAQKAVTALRDAVHARTVRITISFAGMALKRLLGRNPFEGIKIQPSEVSHGGSYIEPDGQERLLERCNAELNDPKCRTKNQWLLFWLMLRTGCRTQEARAFRANSIQGNVWRLDRALDSSGKEKRVKCDQERNVPIMDAELLRHLQMASKGKTGLVFVTSGGKPYSHRNLARTFESVLPGHSPHDLRHTFCTEFVRKNLPLAYLSEITGDRIDTLMKYYTHVQESDVERALRHMLGPVVDHEATESNVKQRFLTDTSFVKVL